MDFTRQTDNEGTYARKLHGLERMTAAMAQHLSYGHIFGGLHVNFKAKNLDRSVLFNVAQAAWIRTRFALPWVACRSVSAFETEKDAWLLTYETCNADIATKWANETLFWSNNIHTLAQWEEILKNAYWLPGDGRYGMEMHMARSTSGGYFFMISIGHWLADGGASLTVLDVFLTNLRKEIMGMTEPVNNLAWGEEISRLPPANFRVLTATSTHREGPLALPDTNVQRANLTIFTYPLIERSQWEGLPSLQSTIRLTQDETKAFNVVCKHHKASITSVLNSIHILADIETALHSSSHDEGSFQGLLKHFKTADVYHIGNHAADRRGVLFPQESPSSARLGAFGNIVCEIFTTTHDMHHIRRCINVQEDGKKIHTILNEPNFWNGMVPDTLHQLKANTSMGATPEGFAAIENLVDSVIPQFDYSVFSVPGISFSSIGRLSSLGLFNDFTPSRTREDVGSPFTLENMALAIRATGPDVTTKVVMVWEYDGKLNIHLLGSPRWHGLDTWNYFERAVEKMLRQIIKDDPAITSARL